MARKKKYVMPEKVIPADCDQLFLPIYYQQKAAMLLQANGVLLAGISHATPGFRIRRTPDFHLALFTLSGDGYLCSNGLEVRPPPRSLILMPAYVEHLYYQDGPRPWEFLWVHLSTAEKRWDFINLNKPVVGRADSLSGLDYAARTFATEVFSLHQEHFDVARPSYLYLDLRNQDQVMRSLNLPVGRPKLHAAELAEHAAETLLLYLERDLLQLLNHEPANSERNQLDLLWNKINLSLADEWTLREMAKHVNMSIPTFIRQVKNIYHDTPGAILQHLRIRQAGQLLLETDMAIGLIAERVGYRKLAAFSAAFRAGFNCSPREYRRANAGEFRF
mgnify:CR=1 FL=1